MKKLLLFSAIFIGAVSASQAGVHVGFGIDLPLPPLPVIISRPAPVVYTEPVYAPAYPPPVQIVSAPACSAPVVISRPVAYCAPQPVVCAPPVYYQHRSYQHGSHSYYGREYDGRGYDRGHDRGNHYGHR